MKRIKDIHWSWDEGRYWDLWMLVHILTGVAFGFFFVLVDVQFLPALLLVIALTILWEFFETHILGIGEAGQNQVIDVIVATLAFITVFFLVEEFSRGTLIALLAGTLLVIFTLDYLGWRARQEREKK